MKNQSVISIPFTGLGLHNGYRGDDWFRHRVGIFKKYTLNSLENQLDRDFLLWVQFRPEEKDNPITREITDALENSKIKYVITYHGIMMHDDRGVEHNLDLIERTQRATDEIKHLINKDYIYETTMGSDDMFHKGFIKTVKSKPFKENGALYMRSGFVYHTNDIIASWYNPSSTGSHTVMYPREIYLNAIEKYKYQNGLTTHEQIPDLFDAEQLPDGMYCAVVHGMNISTIWNHPYRGDPIYYEDEVKELKKCFGIKN